MIFLGESQVDGERRTRKLNRKINFYHNKWYFDFKLQLHSFISNTIDNKGQNLLLTLSSNTSLYPVSLQQQHLSHHQPSSCGGCTTTLGMEYLGNYKISNCDAAMLQQCCIIIW